MPTQRLSRQSPRPVLQVYSTGCGFPTGGIRKLNKRCVRPPRTMAAAARRRYSTLHLLVREEAPLRYAAHPPWSLDGYVAVH